MHIQAEVKAGKQPAAIIFDWDGTLVNTIPGLRKAHNHVRQTLGFPAWTEEQFRANLRHSSRELYPKLYGEQTSQAFEVLHNYIAQTHLENLVVYPETEKLLSALGTWDLPVGLVSNKTHDYLVREVAHLGWEDHFFCVLGAGQAHRDKPAADPLVLALELGQFSLAPEDIWFVGDTETDLLAAQAFGCPAVLITHGEDRTSLIENYTPDLVVDGCAALEEVLHQRLLLDDRTRGARAKNTC